MAVPGPKPSDSDLKILRLVRLRSEPFATAPDIVEQMSVGERQTRNRMLDLVEKGWLDVKMVGSTNVFWVTDQGKDVLAESGN